MAKKLNKTRIQETRLALIGSFLLVIFTSQFFTDGTKLHAIFDLLGYFLIALCVVGRVYCTAFLGGHKNKELITWGPFSVCRNPLYFCSFVGACGIALMSNHVILFVLIPVIFCSIFFAVIRREEVYLTEHFGTAYLDYCRTTPRFFPNFALFHAPETVTVYPRYLWNGVKDGLTWFLAFPVFEFIEYAQEVGYIKPWFTLF